MFEHSIKVPRHYKIAANIVKKVSTEGGSVKTLLYDDKLKHFRTNVLYALITETIKHAADIDKIFEHCMLLENEQRLDPWLAKVLTAELLFGKKVLPGKSKPEQTVLSYKEKFDQYTSTHQDVLKTQASEIKRPRYIRVNTNLLTTSDAIGAFQDEGYRFIRCTSGSYEDYLKQIQNLTEYDFTQDYHVKTMFVFAPGTKLHQHDLYLENQIILQDKATAMAVHLLAPPPGSVILDMCAAPGMKTTQLAAYLRNNGMIYAIERNEKRYQTLCAFVEKTKSTCVNPLHKDVLDIKKGEYTNVEYILLDPSCSGSGMDLSVHNYIEETRLAKLTSLQEKFLKHAMNSFPNAKRIVYSTCSIFPEENERVITNVVKTSRAKWRVQDVKELLKGQWNNFGSAMYGSMGTRCMYARPESDLTTGFFLAVLDRDPKDLERNGVKIADSNKNEKRKPAAVVTVADDDQMLNNAVYPENRLLNENSIDKLDTSINNEHVTPETKNKKKKHKKEKEAVNNLVNNFEELNVEQDKDVSKEKSKNKRKHKVQNEESLNEIIDYSNIETEGTEVPKKKKKKYKNVEYPQAEEQIEETEITSNKKKKRKRDKLENTEPEIQLDITEIEVPKKKKKKRDKIPAEES